MSAAIALGSSIHQRCITSKVGQSIRKKRLRAGSCSIQLGWPSASADPGMRSISSRSAGSAIAYQPRYSRAVVSGLRKIQ